MCAHTSGEVGSFSTHCSALIAVAVYQIWGKSEQFLKLQQKNFWLTFCGHGVYDDGDGRECQIIIVVLWVISVYSALLCIMSKCIKASVIVLTILKSNSWRCDVVILLYICCNIGVTLTYV